jgi:hypothetical protein
MEQHFKSLCRTFLVLAFIIPASVSSFHIFSIFKMLTFCYQHPIVILKELKVTSNKNVVKLNYTLHNDGINSFVFNLTWDHLADFAKMWIYFTVRTPLTKNDKNCRNELIKSVVDVEKVLKGSQSNSLILLVAQKLKPFIVDEFKFPLRKVSQN